MREFPNVSINGADNFKGLELLKGLNSLIITNSPIGKIPEELSSLSNLQNLSLKRSSVASLSGVSKIKGLKLLDITECSNLSDISELADLTQLETLYADGVGLENILSVASGLQSLKMLSVSGNGITDISCLENKSFDYLNISGNHINEEYFEKDVFSALKNSCGIVIYYLQNNGLIKNISAAGNNISVTIENDTGTIYENAGIYIAEYRDDKIIAIKQDIVERLGAYEKLNLNFEFDMLQKGDKIRGFIWSDDIKPLSWDRSIVTD